MTRQFPSEVSNPITLGFMKVASTNNQQRLLLHLLWFANSSSSQMSIVDPRPVVKAAEAVPTPSHRSMSDKEVSINPSRTRRTLILLSFPLIFLLAVPYWWHTTSIERLPLPVDRIAALEHAPVCSHESLSLFAPVVGAKLISVRLPKSKAKSSSLRPRAHTLQHHLVNRHTRPRMWSKLWEV